MREGAWFGTVQTHTEHKQARRNERPLSGFVRGERDTEEEGERALVDRERETERRRRGEREREEIAGWIT